MFVISYICTNVNDHSNWLDMFCMVVTLINTTISVSVKNYNRTVLCEPSFTEMHLLKFIDMDVTMVLVRKNKKYLKYNCKLT